MVWPEPMPHTNSDMYQNSGHVDHRLIEEEELPACTIVHLSGSSSLLEQPMPTTNRLGLGQNKFFPQKKKLNEYG